jgi:dihydrofolate reductase
MQLSVDGFVAGPNNEMDWMTWTWDDKLKDFTSALNDVDTILLGNNMPDGFIPHWEKKANDPSDPESPFAKIMDDAHKVVFTKTREKSDWDRTVLAKGDITEEVNKLKAQDGKDLITYGGADFASSLVEHDLIDDYYLFINPVIIGNGKAIFKKVQDKLKLKLVKATPFECGITVMHYQPERG